MWLGQMFALFLSLRREFFYIFAGSKKMLLKNMRNIKGRDANMRFLFGSVLFFFMIIMSVMLFVYFVLEQSVSKEGGVRDCYEISFSKQFDGLGYDLYLNDSLLYVGSPVSADTIIKVDRSLDENSLLVVDRATDVVSVVEIGRRGRVLIGFGRGGEIVADVVE